MARTAAKLAACVACAAHGHRAPAAAADAELWAASVRHRVSRRRGEPRDVVLFLSGDGGWNLGVISMAHASRRSGRDRRRHRHSPLLAQLEKSTEKCVSPASDFENLSHYLQSKLGLKHYLQPTLVGYSSGATLVYATLAEAPDGLFKGALSHRVLSGPRSEEAGVQGLRHRGHAAS